MQFVIIKIVITQIFQKMLIFETVTTSGCASVTSSGDFPSADSISMLSLDLYHEETTITTSCLANDNETNIKNVFGPNIFTLSKKSTRISICTQCHEWAAKLLCILLLLQYYVII